MPFNLFADSDEHHADDANHEVTSEEKAFDPGKLIMDHIKDSHEWHFATLGNTHITLPLPLILFTREHGMDIFLSNKFDHHTHTYKYFKKAGNKIIQIDENSGDVITEYNEEGNPASVNSYGYLAGNKGAVLDLSITKNVMALFVGCSLLLFIFLSVAKAYRRRTGQAPKGLQSFIEVIIVFVKDEIAVPLLGDKHERYLPYLLTLFFFIWINNVIGLLPGAANVTGNIAFTATLAVATFLIILFSSNKHYWIHIFNTPGVPGWLKWKGFPLLPLVEVMGIFIKPIALCIRLFANMTAGHMIILALISLIFIFSNNGEAIGIGLGIGLVSTAFTVFVYFIEILVAALQAYIFTILTALFISEAIAGGHEEAH